MSLNGLAQKFSGVSKILTAFVVLVLLAAAAIVLNKGDGKQYVTVDFEQTNSVYEGSDVKILGVAVGRVETLTPRGEVVRAKISYDGDVKLPNDVKAVVVSPSIVGDRFVQFAPAYNGGPVLKNDAHLSIERSAVPIELDAIYQSLDDLAVALGPKGANKDGALSSFIGDSAKQLDGQGAQLNQTIRNFGKLSTTLSNNKDELFGSLREVEEFVTLLRTNDATVRSFNDSTARVSEVLEGEREDLAGTLKALSIALVDVNSLVKENRGALKDNIDNVSTLAALLARHKADLEEITLGAPTALTNIGLAYNGTSGTLDTKANIPELAFGSLSNPAGLVCNLLGETIAENGLCASLGGLLDALPELPALPLPRAAAASAPEAYNSTVAEMLAVN